MACDGSSEAGVVIQVGAQCGQGFTIARVACQGAGGKAIQHRQAGTRIGLGENDIEAEDQRAMAVEGLIDELSQQIPSPWPPANLGEGALINVDDRDAGVDFIGRRPAHQRVIGHAVDAIDQGDLEVAAGMGKEDEEDEDAEEAAQPARIHLPGARERSVWGNRLPRKLISGS